MFYRFYKSFVIVFLCVLLCPSPIKAVIPYTQLSGFFTAFKPEFSYLSPLHGFVWESSDFHRKIYRYGDETLGTTQLARLLFYENLPIGLTFHKTTLDSRVATYFDEYDIGLLLGALTTSRIQSQSAEKEDSQLICNIKKAVNTIFPDKNSLNLKLSEKKALDKTIFDKNMARVIETICQKIPENKIKKKSAQKRMNEFRDFVFQSSPESGELEFSAENLLLSFLWCKVSLRENLFDYLRGLADGGLDPQILFDDSVIIQYLESLKSKSINSNFQDSLKLKSLWIKSHEPYKAQNAFSLGHTNFINTRINLGIDTGIGMSVLSNSAQYEKTIFSLFEWVLNGRMFPPQLPNIRVQYRDTDINKSYAFFDCAEGAIRNILDNIIFDERDGKKVLDFSLLQEAFPNLSQGLKEFYLGASGYGTLANRATQQAADAWAILLSKRGTTVIGEPLYKYPGVCELRATQANALHVLSELLGESIESFDMFEKFLNRQNRKKILIAGDTITQSYTVSVAGKGDFTISFYSGHAETKVIKVVSPDGQKTHDMRLDEHINKNFSFLSKQDGSLQSKLEQDKSGQDLQENMSDLYQVHRAFNLLLLYLQKSELKSSALKDLSEVYIKALLVGSYDIENDRYLPVLKLIVSNHELFERQSISVLVNRFLNDTYLMPVQQRYRDVLHILLNSSLWENKTSAHYNNIRDLIYAKLDTFAREFKSTFLWTSIIDSGLIRESRFKALLDSYFTVTDEIDARDKLLAISYSFQVPITAEDIVPDPEEVLWIRESEQYQFDQRVHYLGLYFHYLRDKKDLKLVFGDYTFRFLSLLENIVKAQAVQLYPQVSSVLKRLDVAALITDIAGWNLIGLVKTVLQSSDSRLSLLMTSDQDPLVQVLYDAAHHIPLELVLKSPILQEQTDAKIAFKKDLIYKLVYQKLTYLKNYYRDLQKLGPDEEKDAQKQIEQQQIDTVKDELRDAYNNKTVSARTLSLIKDKQSLIGDLKIAPKN